MKIGGTKMFNGVLGNIGDFKAIGKSLDLFTSGRFTITKDGFVLATTVMGSAGLVSIKLKKSAFSKYDLDADMNVDFDSGHMKKLMEMLSSSGELTFEIDNAVMSFGTTDNIKYTVKQVVHTNYDVLDVVPELDKFNCVFSMDCSALRKILTDVDKVNEVKKEAISRLKIIWDKNGLYFSNGDNKKMITLSAWFSKDKVKFSKLDGSGSVFFNIDMIRPALLDTFGEVVVSIGDNYPMKIEFDDVRFNFNYLLAPLTAVDED